MNSTSSPSGADVDSRIGEQRPRLCSVPEYVSSTGDEAIELAALAGLFLDDWQQFVLRHSLGEKPNGKWAAQTVGLVVGRQNGKGSILEARELAGLFLLGERLIIHTAHLQKTATQHFNRLKTLIKNTPELHKRVAKMPEGKGSEAIHLKNGQTIFFATRSGGGGRGLTSDLIVFDEAMFLSDQDVNSIVPSLAARSMDANIQLWYTGSAVDQMDSAQDGVPFAKIREAGLAESKSTAFFEWSLPYDDPLAVPDPVVADIESARVTNPGHGVRISPEWEEHERTVIMSRRGYCVERLGVGDWPATTEDAGRVIGHEAWAAIAELDSANRITTSRMFAVDANPDRTWAAIGVAGKREDELHQFAVVDHHRGLDWVVDRAKALQDEYQDASFVVDTKSPAAALIDALEHAGVRVIRANTEDYGNACGQFFDAVVNKTVRYPSPQPELDNALASATAAPMGDRWKWARRGSTSADISPLVAVTLALWGSQTQGMPEVHSVREALERLKGTARLVEAAPVAEPVGSNFIPLSEMPAHRGVFRR